LCAEDKGIPSFRAIRESAIVRTIAPGNYTAIVRGVNNTTGIAVVEEPDGWSGVFSAVSAGTGVALTSDVFDYAFNDRIELVRLTPEPKRIATGLITRKGKLSPATEKFCQCAKEAVGG
jgi:DNA-binding transcriptional LysR family regulator